jgi:hypothetical protein
MFLILQFQIVNIRKSQLTFGLQEDKDAVIQIRQLCFPFCFIPQNVDSFVIYMPHKTTTAALEKSINMRKNSSQIKQEGEISEDATTPQQE